MLLHSHAGELLLVQKNNPARGIILRSMVLHTHYFPPFSAMTFNTHLAVFHLGRSLTRLGHQPLWVRFHRNHQLSQSGHNNIAETSAVLSVLICIPSACHALSAM